MKAVAFDVDGLGGESDFLERKARAFGHDLAGGGDEAPSVVDGATSFVAEEVGVNVDGAESAGAFNHELLADFLFAEGEVAGAGVKDDIDSAAREVAAGAVGDPGVFADLEANADAAYFENGIADGEEVVAKFVFDDDAFGPGVEPSGFVVEAITREVFLGDEADDIAIDEDGDGIVDGVLDPDREADGDDHALGFGSDLGEAAPGAFGDFVGEELVLTAITCDGELGQAQDGDVGFPGLRDTLKDAASVAAPVHGNLVEASRAYSDGVAHDDGSLAEREWLTTAEGRNTNTSGTHFFLVEVGMKVAGWAFDAARELEMVCRRGSRLPAGVGLVRFWYGKATTGNERDCGE